jgi:hypothetical protein
MPQAREQIYDKSFLSVSREAAKSCWELAVLWTIAYLPPVSWIAGSSVALLEIMQNFHKKGSKEAQMLIINFLSKILNNHSIPVKLWYTHKFVILKA